MPAELSATHWVKPALARMIVLNVRTALLAVRMGALATRMIVLDIRTALLAVRMGVLDVRMDVRMASNRQ